MLCKAVGLLGKAARANYGVRESALNRIVREALFKLEGQDTLQTGVNLKYLVMGVVEVQLVVGSNVERLRGVLDMVEAKGNLMSHG